MLLSNPRIRPKKEDKTRKNHHSGWKMAQITQVYISTAILLHNERGTHARTHTQSVALIWENGWSFT